jgi:hypothetical protein
VVRRLISLRRYDRHDRSTRPTKKGYKMTKTVKTLKDRFDAYHGDNPHVYDMFKAYTFTAMKKGLAQYSAWAIVNRMRWESDVETTGNKFKLPNDFIALYARKFMEDFPAHSGFFRTKSMTRA